jgi:hypothetical protein
LFLGVGFCVGGERSSLIGIASYLLGYLAHLSFQVSQYRIIASLVNLVLLLVLL